MSQSPPPAALHPTRQSKPPPPTPIQSIVASPNDNPHCTACPARRKALKTNNLRKNMLPSRFKQYQRFTCVVVCTSAISLYSGIEHENQSSRLHSCRTPRRHRN